MRESMPGGQPDTYDPDEARPPTAWEQMCADLEPIRQQFRDAPPPDELQTAAAKADAQQRRHRDHRWHRANQALGG